MNAEVFAGAPPTEFAAGFDFVEDQQRAVFVADLAQAFQEAGLRNAEADVHENGLEDDRRNLVGILFEATLNGSEVVEGGNEYVSDGRFRHAAPARNRGRRMDIAIVGRLRRSA